MNGWCHLEVNCWQYKGLRGRGYGWKNRTLSNCNWFIPNLFPIPSVPLTELNNTQSTATCTTISPKLIFWSTLSLFGHIFLTPLHKPLNLHITGKLSTSSFYPVYRPWNPSNGCRENRKSVGQQSKSRTLPWAQPPSEVWPTTTLWEKVHTRQMQKSTPGKMQRGNGTLFLQSLYFILLVFWLKSSLKGEYSIHSWQLTLILQSPFFCLRGSVETFQTSLIRLLY